MSKQKETGFKIEDFGHVNDGLIKRIEGVIADRKMSRLSSSAIYKAHNELFKLREPIQTCQSCLVIRGDKLAKWYDWYAKRAAPQTQGVQIPVPNVGPGNEPDPTAAQSTYDLEDGRVLTVIADGTVQINGVAAPEDAAYRLADGTDIAIFEGQLITNPEGGAEEATDYAAVIAKYGIVIGEDPATERATIGTNLETGVPEMTAGERALLQTRYDELPAIEVTGGAPDSTPAAAPQIILQKVNKDTYVPEGDALFGIFTPSADDATKGTVVVAETGKALAAGTYATADVTQVLSVQPGGKASYKAVQA